MEHEVYNSCYPSQYKYKINHLGMEAVTGEEILLASVVKELKLYELLEPLNWVSEEFLHDWKWLQASEDPYKLGNFKLIIDKKFMTQQADIHQVKSWKNSPQKSWPIFEVVLFWLARFYSSYLGAALTTRLRFLCFPQLMDYFCQLYKMLAIKCHFLNEL